MKKMRNDHEHKIQRTLIELARPIPGCEWLHAIPNGGKRNLRVARKLKLEGVKSGVLDLFLPVPCRGYHGMYIEVKHGYNKLTQNQKDFNKYAEKNGYYCVTVYSAQAGIDAILWYLGKG